MDIETVVIGAGPYGLSIAAHLRARGHDFRIFGQPMDTWRTQMPKSMFLKSEGFASDLYDPAAAYPLSRFCGEKGIAYANVGVPVALETFSAYGLAFQRAFVPDLEETLVKSVRPLPDGFEVRLEDGEIMRARRVVAAAGISHFRSLPPLLAALPAEFVSHSSRHHELDQFPGRSVAVVGAGSSATDIAAQLHTLGAFPEIVTRRPRLSFQNEPELGRRPLAQRLRSPRSGLGTGWRSRLCTDMPIVFHHMPEKFRLDVVRRHLGPAPCWFTRDQIMGKVPVHAESTIVGARICDGRVHLSLKNPNGKLRDLVVDHVIAATGYKVNLRRLEFLDESIQSRLRATDDAPVLSSWFESSVPDLHFVGAAAAYSFGPLVRFAYGARFTARRLTRHLATRR